jgi:hypothetical protein
MRTLAILMACASLTGCGSNPAEPMANQVAETPEAQAPAAASRNAALSSAEDDNATATAPRPTAVPSAFRGAWAEGRWICGDRSHLSRLVISADTLRFYESELQVARVEQIGPREINIIGIATGEGTTRPAEYHYSIDAAGETLTDEAGGGMVRTRCSS